MENKKELWKVIGSRLKDLLSLFGVIGVLSSFIAYNILTSYIEEIQFVVTSLETHLIFSIVKHVIILFFVLFIITMVGTFFVYYELNRQGNKDIFVKSWWTSSLMIVLLFISYFVVSVSFNLSFQSASILLLLLIIVVGSIEYFIIKKIVNKAHILIVLWQMFYSLLVFAILSMLYINTDIGWGSVFLIIISSIIIHSYPYAFILFSSQSWGKYQYIFFAFVVFSMILFLISPNSLGEASIRASLIGGIEYKKIKITDEECEYLNKYYESKPCKNNMLIDMKGLWLQGPVYYFQDKNGKYKVKSHNIISKVKSRPKKYFK